MEIIKEVRNKIDSPTTDLTWSRYNSLSELLQELDLYLEKIMQNEASVEDDLNLLFAPTGSLQEISISSGWEAEFLEISSRFDNLM